MDTALVQNSMIRIQSVIRIAEVAEDDSCDVVWDNRVVDKCFLRSCLLVRRMNFKTNILRELGQLLVLCAVPSCDKMITRNEETSGMVLTMQNFCRGLHQ